MTTLPPNARPAPARPEVPRHSAPLTGPAPPPARGAGAARRTPPRRRRGGRGEGPGAGGGHESGPFYLPSGRLRRAPPPDGRAINARGDCRRAPPPDGRAINARGDCRRAPPPDGRAISTLGPSRLAAELERVVQGADGQLRVLVFDHAGHGDLGGRDHLDVDAFLGERREHARGDAGVAAHADSDAGDLGHALVVYDLLGPHRAADLLERRLRASVVAPRAGEGGVGEAV